MTTFTDEHRQPVKAGLYDKGKSAQADFRVALRCAAKLIND